MNTKGPKINQLSSAYRSNYCLGENLEFVLAAEVDYSRFVNQTLEEISRQTTFGDVYAILMDRNEAHSRS